MRLSLTTRAVGWLAAACAVLGAAAPGDSTAAESLEYEVKAAMLANFAKFVEWPAQEFADPRTPLVIGVVGKDPFGALLDETVREKTVGGHPIIVKRFDALPDAKEPVHILFLPRSERRLAPQLIALFAARPVLTVSDAAGFPDSGGIIGLGIEDQRVRFRVNLGASNRAGLKISSRLLKLASSTMEGSAAPR